VAIATYADLKASLAQWLHRDDLGTVIPDFIALAEDAMSRDLADLPIMWRTSAALPLAGGSDSLNLPADALGVVYARLVTPRAATLEVVPLASLARTTALDDTQAGCPSAVAFAGNDTSGAPVARVWPKADQAYALEFGYRAAVPALSDAKPSNFILARAPSVYLYGALIASAPYIGDDSRLNLWEAKYRQAIDAVRAQDWDGPMTLGTEISALQQRSVFAWS